MDNDIDEPPGTNKRRQGRGVRARLALVGLVTIALLTAACGSGSKDPGAASADSSSNDNYHYHCRAVRLVGAVEPVPAAAIRTVHALPGVTDYPDPSPGGGAQCHLRRRYQHPVAHLSGGTAGV